MSNPAWIKGISGNPGGKPKGTLSKFNQKQLEVSEELLQAWKDSDHDKIKLVLQRAIDDGVRGRFEGLRILLPYIARLMPIKNEVELGDNFAQMLADARQRRQAKEIINTSVVPVLPVAPIPEIVSDVAPSNVAPTDPPGDPF